MLRGLHTAGSGMIAQQRYQDSLSITVASDEAKRRYTE